MAAHWQVNASFDPWTQPFTLLGPDGRTPIRASVADIMTLQGNAVAQSISEGIQTGAAFLMLLTLLLITSKDKRRSGVFMSNVAALLLVGLRGIVSFLVTTGPFFNFYSWETMYYPNIQSAQHVSAAGEVVSFLLTVSIEISLAMQVRIVCCDLTTWQSAAINAFNGLVVFLVCAMRFALMVVNITWGIEGLESETAGEFVLISKLASATNITLVVSIGISSIIFCTKLGFAIESRRSIGLRQFGPMQIIFVIGCQTMCTPLIFTIVAYWGAKNAKIDSVAAAIVALSLPLSAMWATANTTNRHLAASNDLRQQIPIGGSDLARGPKSSFYTDTTGTSRTLVDNSPRKGVFERDLEMQQVDDRSGSGSASADVRVERAYSVRSE